MAEGGRRIGGFRNTVWRYYAEHGRTFPWRETEREYEILVSELMLQQTQTERVLRKWGPFLDTFPDYQSLANASTRSLLDMWRGLGYNRRALALREICKRVLESGGRLPRDEETLLSYPMIGSATAGSLRAFVFGLPVVFIETNIRRVFIHWFFTGRESVSDKELLPLVEESLDFRDPRRWYYALMDYGVYLKKSVPNPNKKSAHYRKQAPFEGSNRQLRGNILRLLLQSPQRTYEQLSRVSKSPPEQLDTCLEGLERDGFIVKENAVYSIKEYLVD